MPSWAEDAVDGRERLRLGVSSCLLGESVRFDGGHKRDDFLLESLGRYLELFPLCPEVEIGMGVPHHFRKHPAPDWVYRQAYLDPYPEELMLRNGI